MMGNQNVTNFEEYLKDKLKAEKENNNNVHVTKQIQPEYYEQVAGAKTSEYPPSKRSNMVEINDYINDNTTKREVNLASGTHNYINSSTYNKLYSRGFKTEQSIQTILNEILEGIQQISSGGGGGGGMDMLTHRVENLEKRSEKIETTVSDIQLKTVSIESTMSTKDQLHNMEKSILKAIHELPNEDKIKNVIRNVIKDEEIATKTFVKEKITEVKLWAYGIAFGVFISVVLLIVRLFLFK